MGSIVWIASYPKSGNTWLRAFLWNYLVEPDKSKPLEGLSKFAISESHPELYRKFTGNDDLESLSLEQIAMLRPRVQAAIADSVSRTVFVKSHNYLGTFADYPLYNLQVTAGAVYIVRNPLDVVVSMVDHFGLTLDEAIDFLGNDQTAGPTNEIAVAEFYSSWSAHVASWTTQTHPNVLVIRYEDMLERPGKAFQAVLKLINEPRNPDRLKKALRLSSFKHLQGQEAREGFGERSDSSKRFFRAGRKDQWRTVLSREQVEKVIAGHGEQMKRFGYIPKAY